MLVQDLLHLSPLRLITVTPDMTIPEAASRMVQYNVGLVVVMDEADEFVGVLSERDIVTGLGTSEAAPEDTFVSELMTQTVVTVAPEDSLVEAVIAMNNHGIRHLIAAEDQRPVGVMSIRDVLRIFARQMLEDDCNTDGSFTKEFVSALAAA